MINIWNYILPAAYGLLMISAFLAVGFWMVFQLGTKDETNKTKRDE